MNTSALITMIISQSIVIAAVVYFYYKVLKNPQNEDYDETMEEIDEIL